MTFAPRLPRVSLTSARASASSSAARTVSPTRSGNRVSAPAVSDVAVLWREFDGIRHEVPDDLLQSIGITRNRRGGRIKNGVNTNVLGLRSRKDGLDRVGDDAREIDRLNVQTNLAGDDSGDIKNV